MKVSDDIHNYYEKLVMQHFSTLKLEDKFGADFMAKKRAAAKAKP